LNKVYFCQNSKCFESAKLCQIKRSDTIFRHDVFTCSFFGQCQKSHKNKLLLLQTKWRRVFGTPCISAVTTCVSLFTCLTASFIFARCSCYHHINTIVYAAYITCITSSCSQWDKTDFQPWQCCMSTMCTKLTLLKLWTSSLRNIQDACRWTVCCSTDFDILGLSMY